MYYAHIYLFFKGSNSGTLKVFWLHWVTLHRENEALEIIERFLKLCLNDYLRKRTERGHDPRTGEHQLGPAAAGYVGDGEHDGRETVKGDHNHDEPRSIKTKNPRKVRIS